MLKVIKHPKYMDFTQIIHVYARSIGAASEAYKDAISSYEKKRMAENEFYSFLVDWLCNCDEHILFIWEREDNYVSAVRVEPYKDGYLVCGLETRPDQSGKGYAKALLEHVVSYLGHEKPLYSHVDKKNASSLAVHVHAGFTVISDTAAFVDGTVTNRAYTLCLNGK